MRLSDILREAEEKFSIDKKKEFLADDEPMLQPILKLPAAATTQQTGSISAAEI